MKNNNFNFVSSRRYKDQASFKRLYQWIWMLFRFVFFFIFLLFLVKAHLRFTINNHTRQKSIVDPIWWDYFCWYSSSIKTEIWIEILFNFVAWIIQSFIISLFCWKIHLSAKIVHWTDFPNKCPLHCYFKSKMKWYKTKNNLLNYHSSLAVLIKIIYCPRVWAGFWLYKIK